MSRLALALAASLACATAARADDDWQDILARPRAFTIESVRARFTHFATVCGCTPSARAVCATVSPWRSW